MIRRCQRRPAPAVDFARAFWTPPLAPACALRLERKQIADRGLAPMVSLADHRTIEAGLALQEENRNCDTPISVEWTLSCFLWTGARTSTDLISTIT
jgi:hypothetical protein